MSRNLFQKSVAEAMKEYAPVYPESRQWADTVEYLLNHDSDILDELKKQFLKFGFFREPVILKLNDSEESFKNCARNDNSVSEHIGYVADGTHRLVAAHLLGLESILASDDYEEFEDPQFSIVTQVFPNSSKVKDAKNLSLEDSDDASEVVFEKLRSIYVSDDLWITSSFASGGSNGWNIYWDEYDTSLAQVINEAVIARLAEFFPENSFTVKTVLEDWDS